MKVYFPLIVEWIMIIDRLGKDALDFKWIKGWLIQCNPRVRIGVYN
jgi:hypothetical protein